MKRWFFLLLAGFVTVGMIGCGSQDSSVEEMEPTSEAPDEFEDDEVQEAPEAEPPPE